MGCVARLTAAGTNETPRDVVACAKAVTGLSCDNYLDVEHWPAPCTIPPGNLPAGAGCVVSTQCGGGHCAISNQERCGICKTVPRAGEACAKATDCLGRMPCVDGVCVPHPRLGERCDGADRFCIAGLVCRDFDSSGLGTCQKPLLAGATCDPMAPGGEECDMTQSLACDTGTRKCIMARDPFGGIGDPCTNTTCSGVSSCSNGICQPRPRDDQLCVAGTNDCVHPARCIDCICTIRDAAVCQ